MTITGRKFEEHTKCYCALVATAAAGVATAGVAAASAYQQGQQAKKAQENVAKNKDALYGTKVKPVPYQDTVGQPGGYDQNIARDVTGNVRESLPEIFSVAAQVNAVNRSQRKKATGGTFAATQMQEGANILGMERGHVPKDVADTINRLVAENLGGSFDPSVPGGFAGGSRESNDLARKLGLTSLDIMSKGMSFAPEWRKNVDSFIYKPQDVMKDFWTPMAASTMDAAKIQMARDEARYISDNNITRAEAMPDPGAVGSFRDSLTLQTMKNTADKNTADALIGLVNSGAAAYSTYKGAQPATASVNNWQPNARNPTAYRG